MTWDLTEEMGRSLKLVLGEQRIEQAARNRRESIHQMWRSRLKSPVTCRLPFRPPWLKSVPSIETRMNKVEEWWLLKKMNSHYLPLHHSLFHAFSLQMSLLFYFSLVDSSFFYNHEHRTVLWILQDFFLSFMFFSRDI